MTNLLFCISFFIGMCFGGFWMKILFQNAFEKYTNEISTQYANILNDKERYIQSLKKQLKEK